MRKEKQVDFCGKTVFVTGSSNGIGRSIAKTFFEMGATVILHGRNESNLKKLSEEMNDAEYILADLQKEDEVKKIVTLITQKWESLDVLVNNAGLEISDLFEKYKMSDFDKIFSVNVRAVFQLTRDLFDVLKAKGGGSVINVTSVHQELPYPQNSVYCMSKAAVAMFSKVIGIEWAPYQIRVNNLAPGAILTEINKDLIEGIGVGTFSSWIANGKIGGVEDTANACVFLASDMSKYMTSSTINVDGGLPYGLLPYGKTPAIEAMIANLKKEH